MDKICYQSYSWVVGTTSFRNAKLNLKIEQQLSILDNFHKTISKKDKWTWNKDLQEKYYNFMKDAKFINGDAKRKDKDARQKTSSLESIGLITKDREITEVGYELLSIIENQNFRSKDRIVQDYARIKRLQTGSIEKRGWLFDVLNCVNAIPTKDFYLKDIYVFADKLKIQHPDNQNIEAKIRQQMQFLRDKGMIEFLERGHYRKLL